MESFRQVYLECQAIGEGLSRDSLLGNRLVASLDDAVLRRRLFLYEADLNPQGDEPQMKRAWKRRGTGIVVEYAIVIEANPLR